jgi:hypothetical protein
LLHIAILVPRAAIKRIIPSSNGYRINNMKTVIALVVVVLLLAIFPIALSFIVTGIGYGAQALVWSVTHYAITIAIILAIYLIARK